jgi:hypothetical protein
MATKTKTIVIPSTSELNKLLKQLRKGRMQISIAGIHLSGNKKKGGEILLTVTSFSPVPEYGNGR